MERLLVIETKDEVSNGITLEDIAWQALGKNQPLTLGTSSVILVVEDYFVSIP